MAKNWAIPMVMANQTDGAAITNPSDPESKPQKSVAPELDIPTSKSPFSFNFKTVKGQKYEIQAADDLKKWNLVDTIEGTGSENDVLLIIERLFLNVNIIG